MVSTAQLPRVSSFLKLSVSLSAIKAVVELTNLLVDTAQLSLTLYCQSSIVKPSKGWGLDEWLGSRQNAPVPKRLDIAVPTPVSVYAATQAFGSELRVHLIHFYAANPGARQVDAVRALGVERAVVSLNTRALIETNVLTQDGERRYTVDTRRFRDLIRALEEFGPTD